MFKLSEIPYLVSNCGVFGKYNNIRCNVVKNSTAPNSHETCVTETNVANEILMNFRSKRKTAGDVYISDPIDIDKDGNSLTLMDVMAEELDIVAVLDLKEKSGKLHDFVENVLGEREREIIKMRYGLENRLPMTQRDVAKKLVISRSYVSRLEKKALETLRREFERGVR